MLLCLVPIALTGCLSFLIWIETPTSTRAAAAEAEAESDHEKRPPAKARPRKDPTEKQTEYHHKPTKEEQYNVHLELGRFLENQDSFELAMSEYQKALEACEKHASFLAGGKSNEKQAVAHRRMGAILDRLGRFEQSETHYRTALKIHPRDPKVWNDAGYSYYLQSRWADSERALKTAASLDPNNTRVLTNLGLTLAASGKTNEALAAFTKAGGPSVGHTNLAYILAAMGQNDLAIEHYRTALEFQPDFEPAKQALAAVAARIAQTNQIAARGQVGAGATTPVVATSQPTTGDGTPAAALIPGVARVSPPVAAPSRGVTRVAMPATATSQLVERRTTPIAATGRAGATSPTSAPSGTSLAVSRPVIPPPLPYRPKTKDPSNPTSQAKGIAVTNKNDTGITRTSAPTLPALTPAMAPTPGK
jgi:Flp pilus assembly protein TadD